jgi:cobyric acid synthase
VNSGCPSVKNKWVRPQTKRQAEVIIAVARDETFSFDSVEKLGSPHAIIIPGTKSTMADLQCLRHTGLADAIIRFANKGGEVVGICGGYQMLGQSIHDPHHVESNDDFNGRIGFIAHDHNLCPNEGNLSSSRKCLELCSAHR